MSKLLRLIIATIVAATCLQSCSLERLPTYGNACPSENNTGSLSYIIVSEKERCDRNGDCFSDSFQYNVCPSSVPTCYRDTDNRYYCMSSCPSDQVACNGKCVNPDSADSFCGARGGCFSDDPNSDDFKGIECKSYQSCKFAKCEKTKCNPGQHDYGDDCEDDSIRHCGSHDNDCETIGGWLSGACIDGVCVAQSCDDSFLLINGKCTTKRDCKTTPEWCSDDGKTRVYCNDGGFLQETCEGNDRCFNGKCEKRNACETSDAPSCHNDSTRSVCGDDLFWQKELCPSNHLCYQGECFHQSLCKDGVCNDPTPIGGSCASNTFEDKCNPTETGIIRCEYDAAKDGDVYTLIDCKREDKVCKNAKCICDPKEQPKCLDHHTARTCQANGEFLSTPCAPGDICNRGICQTPTANCETLSDCTEAQACIDNKCVFTPRCFPGITPTVCVGNNTQVKSCNERGEYEIETCKYDEICDSDSGEAKCISKRNAFCDMNTFKRRCVVDDDGTQLVELCSASRISYAECTSNNYCAEFDGEVNCYLSCQQLGFSECLTTIQLDKPLYGVCTEAVDAAGVKRQLFHDANAQCNAEKKYSGFCMYDSSNKELITLHVQCSQEVTPSTCSPTTGLCTGFQSCPSQSATCNGSVATNCVPDPYGDGFILLETDCGANPCDVYTPTGDSKTPIAQCYTSDIQQSTGITYTSIGNCHEDGTIRTYDRISGYLITTSCVKGRIEATSTGGRKYCYCTR